MVPRITHPSVSQLQSLLQSALTSCTNYVEFLPGAWRLEPVSSSYWHQGFSLALPSMEFLQKLYFLWVCWFNSLIVKGKGKVTLENNFISARMVELHILHTGTRPGKHSDWLELPKSHLTPLCLHIISHHSSLVSFLMRELCSDSCPASLSCTQVQLPQDWTDGGHLGDYSACFLLLGYYPMVAI